MLESAFEHANEAQTTASFKAAAARRCCSGVSFLVINNFRYNHCHGKKSQNSLFMAGEVRCVPHNIGVYLLASYCSPGKGWKHHRALQTDDGQQPLVHYHSQNEQLNLLRYMNSNVCVVVPRDERPGRKRKVGELTFHFHQYSPSPPTAPVPATACLLEIYGSLLSLVPFLDGLKRYTNDKLPPQERILPPQQHIMHKKLFKVKGTSREWIAFSRDCPEACFGFYVVFPRYYLFTLPFDFDVTTSRKSDVARLNEWINTESDQVFQRCRSVVPPGLVADALLTIGKLRFRLKQIGAAFAAYREAYMLLDGTRQGEFLLEKLDVINSLANCHLARAKAAGDLLEHAAAEKLQAGALLAKARTC